MEERLNKYLAFHLGVSRREADMYIEKGRVAVNGTPAAIGGRVLPTDTVTVDGKPLHTKEHFTYVLLNKPIGYVSSRKQQGEFPTLYHLLPKEFHALKPVGRLDKDSSGLLLLSDDGDFAYQMTHPKFHKTKQYEITLNAPLAPLHQQMISDYGVILEDGPSKLLLERQGDDRTTWIVQMHEGRNRQIRRTFAALGYEVTVLHRTRFGAYTLGSVAGGAYAITKKK